MPRHFLIGLLTWPDEEHDLVEIFALDDEVSQWELELELASGQCTGHPEQLVRLAWHLRQRDTQRACRLALEAQDLLALLPERQRAVAAARCKLVEGEARWLFGALDAAHTLGADALQEFERQGDAAGIADAHWLLAWIAVDSGNAAACDLGLAAAAAAARHTGDAMRTDVFDAAAAIFSVFHDLPTADARWGQRFGPDVSGKHPAQAGWINDYFGTSTFQSSDFGRAIGYLMGAYEAAMMSGQVRRAIIAATNIGNAFTSLNAHHAALEWMQRGLDLARPTGWPMSVGSCLMQTAETLRLLGQHEAAHALLEEALLALAPLCGSRTYAIALEYQGDLALDRGDFLAALTSFSLLKERGDALSQSDFQSGARRGQAHALSHLERPDEALAVATDALALAREQGDFYNQIAALKVLAEIHTLHTVSGHGLAAAPNLALDYLQQALAVAATIKGYTVPGDLLDATARAYAKAGDFARAYEISLGASAARDQTHSQDATNRAIAMQVQYQTENARTKGEHHRQLAASEARRAEVLEQTSATLEHLSAIGQEITAHLDAAAVFRALDRHVHGLLDATHFSIFLLEPDGLSLRRAFGVEAGMSLPPTVTSLSDAQATSARSVRERREILLDVEVGAGPAPSLIPGTLPSLSLLFAPLLIGERLLGVMTVQSLCALAYGERERLIFRTLCAYGAIALDNASAYRQVAATLKTLSATQAQLLDKNLELEHAYKALEDVSLTDQLTGLRNRRFFLQHIDADVAMSLRRHKDPRRSGADARGKDLVFFMVDLDHFKLVNDQHGHAAGDCVLVQMQQRLREVFRQSDYLIRWGGEEFLVLARATDRDDAALVAERIRAAVAGRPFELPDGVLLTKTCSIGFACFPFLPSEPRLLTWSQVVELADQSLYLAKHAGRNAWAALCSTDQTRTDGLFSHLMQHLEQAIDEDEVKLIASPRAAAPATT